MMQANLSEQGFLQLCSPACRLTFLRRWLSLHLQECTRIGALNVGNVSGLRWRLLMSVQGTTCGATKSHLLDCMEAG